MKTTCCACDRGIQRDWQGDGKAVRRTRYITYATTRHPDKFSELTMFGCHPLCVDVTDGQSMTAAVQQIESEQSAVDILINCAGYSQGGPLEELSITALRDNLKPMFSGCCG